MSDTRQPEWKLVAQLGDQHPIDHGGYFIYEDQTGVYDPEGELLISPDSDESKEPWIIYRFSLDRCKTIEVDRKIYLIPFEYDPATWRHPVTAYDEWFHDDLAHVASTCGSTLDELRRLLCSESTVDRAQAYRMIGDHHGFDNLDSYPLAFTSRDEVESRYKDEVQANG